MDKFELENCEVKAVGESNRILRFIGSTPARDRYGDEISVEGWDLKAYKKNPTFLWAHQRTILPVGRTVQVGVEGGKLMFDVEFPPADLNEFAEQVYQYYKLGYLKAVSVGFQSHKSERIPEDTEEELKRKKAKPDVWVGRKFMRQELLELSGCPVGANPEALLVSKSMEDEPGPTEEARAAFDAWFRDGLEIEDENWPEETPVDPVALAKEAGLCKDGSEPTREEAIVILADAVAAGLDKEALRSLSEDEDEELEEAEDAPTNRGGVVDMTIMAIDPGSLNEAIKHNAEAIKAALEHHREEFKDIVVEDPGALLAKLKENPLALKALAEKMPALFKAPPPAKGEKTGELPGQVLRPGWDESANEYRYRVREPSEFQDSSFARVTLQKSPPVHAIIGKLKTTTTIQALRFPKAGWTLADAKAWLQAHPNVPKIGAPPEHKAPVEDAAPPEDPELEAEAVKTDPPELEQAAPPACSLEDLLAAISRFEKQIAELTTQVVAALATPRAPLADADADDAGDGAGRADGDGEADVEGAEGDDDQIELDIDGEDEDHAAERSLYDEVFEITDE